MNNNVGDFYAKVCSNPELQKQIMQGAGGVDALIDNAVSVGGKMGYVFTRDEARAFAAGGMDELPDEMLELIAGGTSSGTGGGAKGPD